MTLLPMLFVWLDLVAPDLETFATPAGSMLPAVAPGDRVVTYHVPSIVDLFRNPTRGDVVIFERPGDPGIFFIKRVIGLPGDIVELTDGRLYINGERVDRRRIADYEQADANRFDGGPLLQYVETLPGGASHRIVEARDDGPFDNTEPAHVPSGHYFLLGDNRDNSLDSRHFTVGMVSAENIVARVFWIIPSW